MAEQQRTPTPYYDYPDDEISLYEVWNTLVRHRLLIGAVFVLAVMAASAYALTRTPIYVMETVFEVGQMASLNENSSDNTYTSGLQRIEEPNFLVTQLNAVIIPEVMDTEAMQGLPAPKASVLNKQAGLVRLSNSIPAELSEKQQRSMQAVLQAIIDRHDAMLADREARIERHLAEAREELALARQVSQALTSAMNTAKDAAFGDQSATGTLRQHPVVTYSQVATAFQDASADISNVRASIVRFEEAASSTEPTRMARAPALGPATNGRSTTTLIGLGAVLGLMVGVFAAFGREFLVKAAEQRKELNDA